MTTPPIACSLTAAGREERAALVRALAADALLDRERTGGRSLVLRFRAAAGVEGRVRAWAELEAECCPFLTLVVDAGESVVTLRIDGPAEAAGIIDDLLPLSGATRPPAA
jgi:hypothetical protein